jgi:hypothetical protein
MKCFEITSKTQLVIMECGGVTLRPGLKLVVKAELKTRLQRQYTPFVSFNECERERLHNGNYQLEPVGESAVISPTPMQAADKSMSNKTRVKRKGK